jgi:hypothetical protein
MKNQKRQNKTKEELLKDLKGNKAFAEKMKFTREMFYPALCKATVSIEDATQQLYMINTMLMQKFLGKMKETKFSELGLTEILSEQDPNYEALKEMLELFADYNAFDAKDIMEGMRNEINLFIQEENKTRKLDDLKTKWIDEL